MPEFKDLRAKLSQARAAKKVARMSLAATRERLQAIREREAALDRVFDCGNEEHVRRRAQLQSVRAKIEAEAQARAADIANIEQGELGSIRDFAIFTDPRKDLAELSDDFPFLLLPVRLETRFKTVGERSQLWVRIYPDDCAVDTFEPTLSQVEVASAQRYWCESWRAGSIDDQERAAWRGLVASHGSGRAAWIVAKYTPDNRAEKPVKAKASDVVLVITTETPIAETERPAVAAFWREVWLANGDRSRRDEASVALVAAVGEARAAEINETYKPVNLDEPSSMPRDEVTVTVAALMFPPADETETKQQSWSQAPKVQVLPDRFLLIGYAGERQAFVEMGNPIPSPLVVGPDPSAPSERQMRPEKGELVLPEDIRWLGDFEKAVAIGMGFRIDLTPEQTTAGFDRLLAVGVRLSADEKESQTLIEELFRHHQNGRSGFSLIPQGTPTNNTEAASSGYSRVDDADRSFEHIMTPTTTAPWVAPQDWAHKLDGQWLAEQLGIDTAALELVAQSRGTDQREARAMNTALWPATLGYMMETMMFPVFAEHTIAEARWFFTNFVSGRGSIPAIRIGKQPYGILPTTAFSRLAWVRSDRIDAIAGLDQPQAFGRFLSRLYPILRTLDAEWARMAQQVSFVGKDGDADQILLDVLGLHSGSVEYYQRYSESREHLFNVFNLSGWGAQFIVALLSAGYEQSGMDVLRALGYLGEEVPEVLHKLFLTKQNQLHGPIVDDRPLSESDLIRSYTDDGRNYIKWLADSARASLEMVRLQQGFADDKPPTALLYLLLRHAIMLGYWDTSIGLHKAASLPLSPTIRREPAFINVREQSDDSESRWSHLYKTALAITGSQSQRVADFISKNLARPEARYLAELLDGLDRLTDVPTARLERTFAEHIDCCSYRLDAWLQGLVRFQLATMRYRRDGEAVVARKGVYLGAYGWLEDVRPKPKALTVQPIDLRLSTFFRRDEPPVMRDPGNGGYIHAPSLNQAVAAAILRSGYIANTSPDDRSSLAVNLSSERVRLALSILDGMRNGQSLGALLGYRFERGLHDRHDTGEVDQFISRMRKAFPLRANRILPTSIDEDNGVPIEALEARNVLDGVSLVEQINKTGIKSYPFGIETLQSDPAPGPGQAAAINREVERLLDIHDALADLALSEGVYQAAQGNFDRAAATLDTYSKGTFPPEPEVVRTPRSGIALTHRVGLHLEAGLTSMATPRAKAEPALNAWLREVLPSTGDITCRVTYFDPRADGAVARDVSLQDLGLEPIDILLAVRPGSEQAMAELDDRIMRHVAPESRGDAEIRIDYLAQPADKKIRIFELAPLLESLRSVILRSRALRPSDLSLQTEARQGLDEAIFVDKQRIDAVVTGLQALHLALAAYHTSLIDKLNDLQNNRSAIISGIDQAIDDFAGHSAQAAFFGIPQSGWGFALSWKRGTFSAAVGKVVELSHRWEDKLERCDALIAEHDNLAPSTDDAERVKLLQRAELSVAPKATYPPPANSAEYREQVITKRDAFAARLELFRSNISRTDTNLLNDLLNDINLLLPVSEFDPRGLDLSDIETRIVQFTGDLAKRADALRKEMGRRIGVAEALIGEHDSAAGYTERVTLLESAAKALLGDDFRIIPEFGLEAEQAAEWDKALGASQSGELLSYLTDAPNEIEFPVDEWLHGVARVREKMRHWEQTMLFSQALAETDLALEPIQLPHSPGDRWLGLEFPATLSIEGDRLLYTAHYAKKFDKAVRQCGLLIDEWNEVIPSKNANTGIVFHYDRPSAEPPQAMLLVTPAASDGVWHWEDLVDALNETLQLAKKRAVEPVHVDATGYARFLPATIMASTLYQISIATNLAVNNEASR